MSELWRWLLGLERLSPSDAGVEFGFAHALPLWAWALVALAAVAVAWRSYTRLEGARWARFGLGLLRSALLVLLALLIAGPRLTRTHEIEEKDWVLVLVDRSASMNIRDAAETGGGGATVTRDALARRALDAAAPALAELAHERVLVFMGFDAGAYELRATDGRVELGEAAGRRTDVGRALEQALARASARPISGVVILSDGRSAEEPTRALLRRLEAEKVPVFSVALGNPEGVTDVAVRRADAPRSAFANDSVPVQVELSRVAPQAPGGAPARTLAGVSVVELVDLASGEVLDTQRVEWSKVAASGEAPPTDADAPSTGAAPTEQSTSVRLVSRAGAAGKVRWGVRVRPGGSSDGANGSGGRSTPATGALPDLIESNNSAEFSVELVDRPLRVLYIDGYPRWEYRYLKNLLVREPSLSSAVLLLSPRRKYLQEGTIILDSLPRSPEEWANFDVVVLGDLWPGMFTTEQLMQIKERVSLSGMGLVWIGGEGSTPAAWRTTPLADLLPFTLSASDGVADGAGGAEGGGLPAYDEPVVVRPTPAADRLGVLRLADTEVNGGYWPAALSDPRNGWSLLHWAQRIDPRLLKPTTEVLAVGVPASTITGAPAASNERAAENGAGALATPAARSSPSPLVLSMRYGAGRVLYIGTDEIWRWRFARGEPLTERFYIQMLRLLGRESLSRSGRPAVLEVEPARAEINAPVRVRLTLLEQSLVDAGPTSIKARVRPLTARDGGGGVADAGDSAELTLLPRRAGGAVGGGPGLERGPATREFVASWVPQLAGRYLVEVIDPLLASRGAELSAPVEVYQSDDELRRPQADPALLARLSSVSGGRVLTPDELTQLGRFLPNRRVKTAGEPEIETLWDTPGALLLAVLLWTVEWIGRRMLRFS